MNARHVDDTLANLVGFKWLMAGVGWWVDLSRLQRDRSYIDECLRRALGSESELLRKLSVELLGLQPGIEAADEFLGRRDTVGMMGPLDVDPGRS